MHRDIVYREMTAEEKLEFSSKIIEAIKMGGLAESLRVVEEYKKILSNDIEELNSVEEEIIRPELIEEVPVSIKTDIIKASSPNEASIYASKHLEAVADDLREHSMTGKSTMGAAIHPKTLTLKNPNIPASNQSDITVSAPSIYQDAQIVEPGHFLR